MNQQIYSGSVSVVSTPMFATKYFFRALGKIIREIPEKRYACMIHFDTTHPSGLISPIISAQETAFMKTDDDTLVRVGPLMEVAELSGR